MGRPRRHCAPRRVSGSGARGGKSRRNDSGVVYSMLRDYDSAFEDFQKALRLNPDLTEVYIKRGDAFLARARPGDNELAINKYNQAIRQYRASVRDQPLSVQA